MRNSTIAACLVSSSLLLCGYCGASPIIFSVGGDNTTGSIQPSVDAFRAAVGNPNNLNNAGPILGGRREINWDGGGGVSTTTPPVTPFNTFLNRGAQFTTPGTGLSQATPDGLGVLVNNPTYGADFSTFSPLRLFAPIGSNITDGFFSIPGSNALIPASVNAFGAVFTDVDLANTTRIDLFSITGSLLLSSFVTPGTVANGSLSFLGVRFDAGEQIGHVRITTGTSALGPNDNPSANVDVVAMDDFIYAEPRAVPEPATLSLLGLGLAGLGVARRRAER